MLNKKLGAKIRIQRLRAIKVMSFAVSLFCSVK